MRYQVVGLVVSLAAVSILAAGEGKPSAPEGAWMQWRGPQATGVAPDAKPPLEWSETKNVRWKVAIPGKGHSTPIVHGDRVFVTTAVAHGKPQAVAGEQAEGAHHNHAPRHRMKFVVLALRRSDGRVLWQRTVIDEQPHDGAHETGSWASASPLTDGKLLFAHFGSRGLFALDLDGEVVWKKDLGDMQVRHGHGEGSSPALHGDTLVVNWDHEGDSFLLALDKRTGKERWRVARDEMTSWSTPLIVESSGKMQVVVSATGRVRGYELKTGREIWSCAGLSRNVVATPVAADGHVYAGNSYDWKAMLAIRLDGAKGDITETDHVVWRRDRDTPYVPSPLLYDGTLCYLKHSHGFLTCVDAGTGKVLFGPERLGEARNIFASPVGAAGRIYIPSREGTTVVVRHGSTFEKLAVNRLDDSFSASPALAGRELYLRGDESLYCIAED
ncbi:MAG: PQQ-binding-like beta-propeller repeat protein [bacterium]|nr:PQQ-binding-like beta-propeller repeat protein [bacterium]